MKLSHKALVLPFLVAGLAACGGGSDSGNTGPSEPSTPQVVTLSGEITSDTTLQAANQYLLRGAVERWWLGYRKLGDIDEENIQVFPEGEPEVVPLGVLMLIPEEVSRGT